MILNPEELRKYFDQSWFRLLEPEMNKEYFQQALASIKAEAVAKRPVYPKFKDMWRPWMLPINKVRVVIVADQPLKDSNGLAFSTDSMELSSQTINLFQEILYSKVMTKQVGITLEDVFCCGDLTQWHKQGVMLLNTCLTTGDTPNAHKHFGWQSFTTQTLTELNKQEEPIVFILFSTLPEYEHVIDISKHHVIVVDKVRDSNCFMDCAKFLKERYPNQSSINWYLWQQNCPQYVIRVLNEGWKDIPRLADQVKQEWRIPTYFRPFFEKYFGVDWINLLDMFGANKMKNLIQVTCYSTKLKNPKKGKEFIFEEDNFLYLMQTIGKNLTHESTIQIEIEL